MAVVTFFSHAAFMRIILFMTIYAIILGDSIVLGFLMAIFTRKRPVFTFELEFGSGMIEHFRIHLHDIHVTPFMIRVAGMTFPIGDIV